MSRKSQLFTNYLNEERVSRDPPAKKDKTNVRKNCTITNYPTENEKLSTAYTRKTRSARTRSRSRSAGQHVTRRLNAEPSYSSIKAKEINSTGNESWSQIFKSSKTQSTFNKFDPLRTLHFLIKELECRVRNDIPDVHLQQIVHDMLSALNRVPPEVASTIHLHQNMEKEDQLIENSKRYQSSRQGRRPEKEIKTYKTLANKSAQTPRSLYTDDTEAFRKEVEASTMKLEESCKQMEVFCEKLKAEKHDLEQKCKIEKENVKALKKRCKELEEQKTQKEQLIEQLIQERDTLKATKSQHHETPAHVKTIIKELTAQKLEVEKDCVTLRHQLAVSDLEKEKYITLLAVRERQCREIRDETQQLQEVIKKQLLELSGVNAETREGNNTLSSIQSYLPEQQQKHDLLNGFGELQSGDSSAANLENKKLDSSDDHTPSRDILTKASNTVLLADITHNNNVPETLKQVFEELKREAYSITANLYNHS